MLFMLLAVTVLLAAVSGCSDDPGEDSDKGTVMFADLNWDSALLHTRIAQFIVEHGYGYEVDGMPGDTIPLFQGLRRGDLDVSMEIWVDNQQEAYDQGIEAGDVIDLGTNFGDNEQGLYVPTYVIEGDEARGIEPMAPNLRTIDDLAEYWEVFQDPEDPTKGRLYGGIAGWEADIILSEKVVTYGLEDYYNYFRPGTDAALAASLVSAYERGEAWFGYYWSPTWIYGQLDLTLIEEPAYSDELWDDGYACAFPSVPVNILVNSEFYERSPELVEFFTNYETTSALISDALAFMQENDADHDEAAAWFLREKEDVWTQWVPADVADKVKEAL